MKYILILLNLILSVTLTQAQSIQRSVVGAAGRTTTGNGPSIRFTVGEAITGTHSSSGQKIKQGFQQGITPNLALPVSGFEFFAQRESNHSVELRWKTQSEYNNKGFYIERKLENETLFIERGFVPAARPLEQQNLERSYQFEDENSYSGLSYYRIRQEDVDGKNNISLVRLVHGEAAGSMVLQVWPIPSNGSVYVRFISKTPTELMLLDAKGALLQTVTMSSNAEQRIDGLLPGVYWLSVKGEKTLCEKIVVQ